MNKNEKFQSQRTREINFEADEYSDSDSLNYQKSLFSQPFQLKFDRFDRFWERQSKYYMDMLFSLFSDFQMQQQQQQVLSHSRLHSLLFSERSH